MAIITISREFGSKGNQVSEIVAESLNFPLVDKNAIEHVLVQYGMVQFDEIYESDHSIWQKFDKDITRIVKMLDSTIQAFAANDNVVIIGRGAFAILQGYQNVLNVAIREPIETRIGNVMKEEDISRSDAEILVNDNDQVRQSFIQTYYGIKEDLVGCFDLAIDTSIISNETAARWIIEAAHEIDHQDIKHDASTKSIEVDKVLANTVSEVLKNLADKKPLY